MPRSTAGTWPWREQEDWLGTQPEKRCQAEVRAVFSATARFREQSSASPEVQGSGRAQSGSRPPSRLLRRGKMAASHTSCRAPRREQSLDRLRNDNVQLRGQVRNKKKRHGNPISGSRTAARMSSRARQEIHSEKTAFKGCENTSFLVS
ncbi:hypothetical protein V5799_019593 [Amblyomma americanum]|uniref:Uncharacterized protein n=1 Tax=Amblyomma americanum TaxID=6943 RepID=A0AAQ4EWH1_AMBAM